jgi:hypothetical protein
MFYETPAFHPFGFTICQETRNILKQTPPSFNGLVTPTRKPTIPKHRPPKTTPPRKRLPTNKETPTLPLKWRELMSVEDSF